MKWLFLVIGAIRGAVSGLILALVLWFFMDAGKWPQALGFPPWPAWIAALAGGITGAVLGLVHAAADIAIRSRRTGANRELAQRNQFEFEEEVRLLDWPSELLAAIHTGELRTRRERTRGRYSGLPVDVADLTFIEHSTDSEGHSTTTEHEQTVVVWDVKPVDGFPPFAVRPRGWKTDLAVAFLGRGAAIVGFDADALAGADAVTVREFNRRYVVIDRRGGAEQGDAVRKLFVPSVMRGLLDAGPLEMAAVGCRIASWRTNRISSGAGREQAIRQSHKLSQLLVAAHTDPRAVSIPADLTAAGRFQSTLWPLGCAVAGAIPAAFLGTLLFFFVIVRRQDGQRVEIHWFPVTVFGCMLVGLAIGWLAGFAIRRISRPND